MRSRMQTRHFCDVRICTDVLGGTQWFRGKVRGPISEKFVFSTYETETTKNFNNLKSIKETVMKGEFLRRWKWSACLVPISTTLASVIQINYLNWVLITKNLLLIGHVRYINILTWLRGFRVKIVIVVSSSLSLNFRKRRIRIQRRQHQI